MAGAVRFLDAERKPGEPVVTVEPVPVTLAFQRYYALDWRAVETRAELESVRAGGRTTLVVYTFSAFVRSHYPEPWEALRAEFTTVRVFRGTLGDGEVYVCKAEGR